MTDFEEACECVRLTTEQLNQAVRERDEAISDRDNCVARMKEARRERLVAMTVAKVILEALLNRTGSDAWLDEMKQLYPWLQERI